MLLHTNTWLLITVLCPNLHVFRNSFLVHVTKLLKCFFPKTLLHFWREGTTLLWRSDVYTVYQKLGDFLIGFNFVVNQFW